MGRRANFFIFLTLAAVGLCGPATAAAQVYNNSVAGGVPSYLTMRSIDTLGTFRGYSTGISGRRSAPRTSANPFAYRAPEQNPRRQRQPRDSRISRRVVQPVRQRMGPGRINVFFADKAGLPPVRQPRIRWITRGFTPAPLTATAERPFYPTPSMRGSSALSLDALLAGRSSMQVGTNLGEKPSLLQSQSSPLSHGGAVQQQSRLSAANP